ncbi:dehydrogenase/reductase SDR family member 11-like [Ischnura elegans]|uniref:dehydrogenase/reductase SDR family member 11-like n=1 Tax=Ischnura elegans TaxID=197161 RepID=UPI001ED88479|nr:dehydrogenase/reductase SDR family member 11-like [Ischnura elegans]
MERWQGRVAVVTGASAGIGEAIARALVKSGLKVVGMARRVEKMEAIAKDLVGEAGQMFAVQCDVADESSVIAAFKTVEETHGGADVLVNNAGVAYRNTLLDGSVESWTKIMAVNVIGLSHCTKLAIESMMRRGVDDGHIIHISSVAAHVVPSSAEIHFYAASKHAVRALTEGLRHELRDKKSHIKITSISPGLVKSDIYEACMGQRVSDMVYSTLPYLEADDVADSVISVLSSKPSVQVHEMIIKPFGEAY